MLAVSFMGKKFSCDAQFEVADEIEGDGLRLNLRVREMCKKYAKPHGPVLATLHVSVSNGRPNDVTKCKEVLAFLKEQVLPKTLKLISLKRIQKIKDKEKNEGANWLRCIWPGKTRKRKHKTKRNSRGLQTTRGYSSDSENYIEKCRGQSNLPDIETLHQASDAGILATPMLSRPQFMRKAKENKKKLQDENVALKCSLKRICQEKGKDKDGKIVQKSEKNKLSKLLLIKNGSSELRTKKDQEKEKHGRRKDERSKEIGPQYVQSKQPDWKSCSDISASDSFVGFFSFNKATEENNKSSTIDNFEFGTLDRIVESTETELQEKSNLLTPDVTGISRSCPMKLCGVQKQNLESFAATFVGRICEAAISRHVKEKTKEIAKEFVADIFQIAKIKIIQQEKSKSQTCCYEDMELPSFSKVWKYSRAFPAEISETFKSYDSVVRDEEFDTCASSKDDGDIEAKNDRQFEEFLEKNMVESLESSNDGPPTLISSNSSSKLIDLETQEKAESFSLKNSQKYYGFDKAKELIPDSSLAAKATRNIRHSNEIVSETRNQVLIKNCDMKTNEITVQGEVETSAVHVSILEESRTLNDNCQETGNSSAQSKTSSKDCKILNIDSNPKGHDESKVSAEMFSSGLSNDAVHNAESFIPEGKSSETSYDQCVLKKHGNYENDNKTEPCSRRRPIFYRTLSESQASERKQWSPLESGDSDLAMHSFHSSTLSYKTAQKYVRSSSCPVVSEDDVMFESMQSDHRDVHDSLSKRTWIILHVHELWNGGKPMDAIKTCIDMTGMADVEQDTPYAQDSRDYALFLNILQQLPSSCSLWSLDLFVLVLPKLKRFISSQHHTSHVEMACGIIHVVLKKVAVVIRRTSKANKNKDKELKVKVCTNELKEIKDMTNDVIQAVKSGNRSNSEDPGSMKSVLKELQLALGTFFEQL